MQPSGTSSTPDFVVAGNLTRDVVPEGWRPGGAAVYAACVALGLGRRVGVVTCGSDEVAAAALPPTVAVVRNPAPDTTFENRYTGGHRIQYLRAPGEPVPAGLVPEAWLDAPVALIGTVFHEVRPALARRFRGALGVCVQGYLRRVDGEGRVHPIPPLGWDAGPVLRHARVVFASTEDLGEEAEAAIAKWLRLAPLVVVTDGDHGAWVHQAGERRLVPAARAEPRDPTGAGDSFAAAFMVALDEGHDPWQAAAFAAATAAVTVETNGPVVPERAAVLRRMRWPGAS